MVVKKKSKKGVKIKKPKTANKPKVKKARAPQQITLSTSSFKEPEVLIQPVSGKVAPLRLSVSTETPSTSFATLSYLVQLFNLLLIGTGAVISILIYFLATQRFTKFHALQATFLGIVVSILSYVLKDSISNGAAIVDPVQYPMLYPLVAVVVIIVSILLALKAYKSEWIELPLFGGLAGRFI